MNTMELVMFLAPLVVGFGAGYLANRQKGEDPKKALLDSLESMFAKYLGGKIPAPVPAAPVVDPVPAPPFDASKLFELVHKLIDKLEVKTTGALPK
jgi:hypothetical protein